MFLVRRQEESRTRSSQLRRGDSRSWRKAVAGGRPWRAEGRGGRKAVAGGSEFAARPVVADTVWVQRISVVGNSGSGKTTLAGSLATALGVPRLELDSVFHQPGWQPLDSEEFRRTVSAFASGEAWVTDGNYSAVQ